MIKCSIFNTLFIFMKGPRKKPSQTPLFGGPGDTPPRYQRYQYQPTIQPSIRIKFLRWIRPEAIIAVDLFKDFGKGFKLLGLIQARHLFQQTLHVYMFIYIYIHIPSTFQGVPIKPLGIYIYIHTFFYIYIHLHVYSIHMYIYISLGAAPPARMPDMPVTIWKITEIFKLGDSFKMLPLPFFQNGWLRHRLINQKSARNKSRTTGMEKKGQSHVT